ncbi:hypothetical protein [Endozoicomonas sp. ONNA2]|uniref:hypothetical protein n=1 Tax=Endozoicomonas sp. ONNA2 TaxID=2828741 RepID=UPI0021478E6B|nr:hypothetical protein [Endozoicomonas sp. ONNA2]
MSSQEQNGQVGKEEYVSELLSTGLEGYFFKLQFAMLQEIFQNPMMIMQGLQKKTADNSLQGTDENVDDANAIREKLILIFNKLVTENLELKLENAILRNSEANDTKNVP